MKSCERSVIEFIAIKKADKFKAGDTYGIKDIKRAPMALRRGGCVISYVLLCGFYSYFIFNNFNALGVF